MEDKVSDDSRPSPPYSSVNTQHTEVPPHYIDLASDTEERDC